MGEEGEVRPVSGATVGEVCCHVTGQEKVSSTVSFHLKELRLAGLIEAEKQGKFMICSVRREAVVAMKQYLAELPMALADECADGQATVRDESLVGAGR